mmetsp:Transcript_866/g.1279  ORF Transcript_866/g.1279 Transcript_866/m.1279 type:complete len:81 (+) Transcript_866:603-845(+)
MVALCWRPGRSSSMVVAVVAAEAYGTLTRMRVGPERRRMAADFSHEPQSISMYPWIDQGRELQYRICRHGKRLIRHQLTT